MPQEDTGEPRETTEMANDSAVASNTLMISLSVDDPVPASTFLPFFLPLVPEENPVVWAVVNNSLTISGCVLVLDMFYAKGEISERAFAAAFYLIWEFATCFFWTLEASLSATYQRYHLQSSHLPWYTKLEIGIAAYFMGTTFWFLFQWNVMNQPIENEKIGELLLDTSCYMYISVRGCLRSTATEDINQPSLVSQDEEEGGESDALYQSMPNNEGGVLA